MATNHQPDAQLLAQTHLAFRFVVEVETVALAAFTECTLPVVDWEIEEVKEGGLNSYVHQLPGRRKAARLTLKNGVGKGELWRWCTKALAGQFERKTLTIKLLDPHFHPIAIWHVNNACPLKWTGPQLKSDDNSVAIQSIEFACGEIAIDL